jgi:hypothetical protein
MAIHCGVGRTARLPHLQGARIARARQPACPNLGRRNSLCGGGAQREERPRTDDRAPSEEPAAPPSRAQARKERSRCARASAGQAQPSTLDDRSLIVLQIAADPPTDRRLRDLLTEEWGIDWRWLDRRLRSSILAVKRPDYRPIKPARDRKLKESAVWLASSGPQASAVGFDDRAADCQSHSHAVGLCRVEWFKETREGLRAQPSEKI